jgi:hypothetical protein
LDFKWLSSRKQLWSRMAWSASCIVLGCSLLSCYEDLPPVEQPIEVQQVSFGFNVANDGLVMLDAGNQPLGSIGSIDIHVTNLYSEYLSDTAQIEAEVSMYIKDMPEKNVVVTLTKEDLWSSGILTNGLLVIAPRQAIRIMKLWSHRTQGGEPFVDFTDTPKGVPVLTQTGKVFQAFPVHVMVKASVKVFKNRPTEYWPVDRYTYTEITLYYTYG